jgi:hypothetical protein
MKGEEEKEETKILPGGFSEGRREKNRKWQCAKQT